MNYEKTYKEALEEQNRGQKENIQSVSVKHRKQWILFSPNSKKAKINGKGRDYYYLKKFIPHHEHDLVAKSKLWIAWLEKQGEQKSAWN